MGQPDQERNLQKKLDHRCSSCRARARSRSGNPERRNGRRNPGARRWCIGPRNTSSSPVSRNPVGVGPNPDVDSMTRPIGSLIGLTRRETLTVSERIAIAEDWVICAVIPHWMRAGARSIFGKLLNNLVSPGYHGHSLVIELLPRGTHPMRRTLCRLAAMTSLLLCAGADRDRTEGFERVTVWENLPAGWDWQAKNSGPDDEFDVPALGLSRVPAKYNARGILVDR